MRYILDYIIRYHKPYIITDKLKLHRFSIGNGTQRSELSQLIYSNTLYTTVFTSNLITQQVGTSKQ